MEEEAPLGTKSHPSEPDDGGSSTMGDSKSPSDAWDSPFDLTAPQDPSANGKGVSLPIETIEAEDPTDSVYEVATVEPQPQRSTALEVRCLGTMSVTRDGVPIGTGWFKRSKELLAYLVANRQGVPKDRILDVFFPDLEPKQAERLLRDAIYYVRRQALAQGEATWSDAYLTRAGQNIVLGHDEWWADAWEFERLVAQAAELEGTEAARSLRLALDLYRGEFCDDAYFSWLEPIRERYRRLFLKATVRLAELLAVSGDSEGAIEALERGIEVDPYCEDLYRRAIELEASEGRVNAAEQHYQKLAKVLAEELGVEPEPKTMELMAEMTRSRRQLQTR
jgi:DNA-binding SARP family transcriptional activator